MYSSAKSSSVGEVDSLSEIKKGKKSRFQKPKRDDLITLVQNILSADELNIPSADDLRCSSPEMEPEISIQETMSRDETVAVVEDDSSKKPVEEQELKRLLYQTLRLQTDNHLSDSDDLDVKIVDVSENGIIENNGRGIPVNRRKRRYRRRAAVPSTSFNFNQNGDHAARPFEVIDLSSPTSVFSSVVHLAGTSSQNITLELDDDSPRDLSLASSIIALSDEADVSVGNYSSDKNDSTSPIVIVDFDATQSAQSAPTQSKVRKWECPICLDSYRGQEVCATRCGHVFCRKCITSALRSFTKCPTCRKRVSKKQLVTLYNFN